MTAGNAFVDEMAVFGKGFVGLGNDVLFFFISRNIVNLFRYDARFFVDAAVRSFNETEFIDLTEASQGRSDLPAFLPGTCGHSANGGRRGLQSLRVHGTNRRDQGRSDGVYV